VTAERVDDKRSRNADWAILSVLFAVGLVRIYTIIRTLGDRSFRNDEAYTYSFVTASWSDFHSVIRHLDVGVAAYYVVVRTWSTFAGASESSLRLFSVVFAIFATVALYYLAHEFYPRRVSITAALLLLCNAFWFQQAQTARVYTLAGFLAVVASIAFIRAVRAASDRRWVAAYLALMVLLAIFQLAIGLTLLTAHILSFYAVPGRRMPVRSALPLFIALCLIFALALYIVASVGTTLLHTPVHLTPTVVWVQIASLLGRKESVVGLGALAIYGIAISGRANRSNAITLAIWAIVPIALIVAMSLFDPATLGSRYMLGAIFPFVILASNGAWQAQRKPVVAVLLLVAMFVEGYGLREYLKEPRRNLEGEVTAFAPLVRKDDVVLFVPPFLAVRVYMALHNSQVRLNDGVETIPGPLDKAWQTVDQQSLEPNWSRLPPLGQRHLWVVTMPNADARDNAGCNQVMADVAPLKPGEATILCIPRERQ
jgi:4-amino-4-deoxy-L-arabinose transferase-like glycosyltransferase